MNLLPKDDVFFKLFVISADKVHDSAVILQQMVQEISNAELIEAKVEEIKKIEIECDINTHEILFQLNKSFVTPLDREDIYQIATELDEITDNIEHAAYWLMAINVRKVRKEAKTLCDLIVMCSIEIQKIMGALKNTNHMKDLASKIIEVNRIENEGDTAYRNGLRRLFNEHVDSIEVIKWREVFIFLEKAMNASERVANTVEGVVMKHA